MNKKIIISACVVFMSFIVPVYAQVKDEVKQDAKKVGHKTEELSSKAAARITDKVYADKVGPDGQTIYINKHSKYYWVDKEGHKKFITKVQMKDKEK